MCIKFKQQFFMFELKERAQVGGNFEYQGNLKKKKKEKNKAWPCCIKFHFKKENPESE